MVTKAPTTDEFDEHNINIGDHYLDEVKLKIDNINKRYLINSFYYKQKRGNIDGLLTTAWDRDLKQQQCINFC